MNFVTFNIFLAFLLLCGLVSDIFTNFSRGSEICLAGCDSYGNFGDLKKKKIFDENFVIEDIVLEL